MTGIEKIMIEAVRLDIATEVEAMCIIASVWFARDNANEDFTIKYGTIASEKAEALTLD